MNGKTSAEKKALARRIAAGTLFFWPLLLAFFGQRFLAARPELAETVFARGLFPLLVTPIGYLTSRLPFSLTEAALILAVFLGLPFFIWRLVLFIRRPGRKQKALHALQKAALAASLLYLVFMLLHGFNFARLPLSESFDFPARPRTTAELAHVSHWLIERTNELRENLDEDEHGVFVSAASTRELFSRAHLGYQMAALDYPELAGFAVRPKPVRLSPYWSYTGISGMYFPFFAEANVNTGPPTAQVLDTALHEIAHVRGFAREDEADFLAFLTGTYHPDPEYRYAALLAATRRCLNALHGSDRERRAELVEMLGEGPSRDLAANREYWRGFEGPVRQASTSVNHAFLQANLQEDGVRSYGRSVDLILAFFWQAKEEGSLETIETRLAAAPAEVE